MSAVEKFLQILADNRLGKETGSTPFVLRKRPCWKHQCGKQKKINRFY